MQWFRRKTRVTVSPIEPIIPAEYQSSPTTTTDGTIIQQRRNRCQQCCSKENLKEQALLLATIVSVIIGVAVGIALRGLKCSSGTKMIYEFERIILFQICASMDVELRKKTSAILIFREGFLSTFSKCSSCR